MANLKWGTTGKPVSKAQTDLNKTKIAGKTLVVDGIFGPKTFEGVKTFQKNEKISKLKVDGVIGKKTQTALDEYLKSGGKAKISPEKTAKAIDAVTKKISSLKKSIANCEKLIALLDKNRKEKNKAYEIAKKLFKEAQFVLDLSHEAAETCGGGMECVGAALASERLKGRSIDIHNRAVEIHNSRLENEKDTIANIKVQQKFLKSAKSELKALEGELSKLKKKQPA